jgi:hypothetical protein
MDTGLRAVEYRGWDSFGAAICDEGNGLVIVKAFKIPDVIESLQMANVGKTPYPKASIGHARMATQGSALNIENAHPHTDCTGKIAVVHNGCVSNYWSLRDLLREQGHSLTSGCDTEVFPHLIEEQYGKTGNLVSAVAEAVSIVAGSFALLVVHEDEPGTMVAVRHSNPLLLGMAQDGFYASSDLQAILPYTSRVMTVDDNTIAVMRGTKLQVQKLEMRASYYSPIQGGQCGEYLYETTSGTWEKREEKGGTSVYTYTPKKGSETSATPPPRPTRMKDPLNGLHQEGLLAGDDGEPWVCVKNTGGQRFARRSGSIELWDVAETDEEGVVVATCGNTKVRLHKRHPTLLLP